MGMVVNRVCIMVRYDNTTNQFIYSLDNRDVQTITIPSTVVRLNGQAFNYCKKLEQISRGIKSV